MTSLPILLSVPILFAFDWSNISGGSVAIIASLFIIGGFFYKYFPGAQAALDTSQAANDSLQRLLNGTIAELAREKDAHASVNEALEVATNEAHRVELLVKDREKEIARLEAMPDTDRMLQVFEDHHGQNLELLDRIAQTLQTLVGAQGDTQAILQALAMPGRARRRTDPNLEEETP